MNYEKVKTEIEELHQLFEDWFTAKVPNDDTGFERVSDALDTNFQMVVPSGKLITRDPLLDGLRLGYGAQPGIRIWIENVALHQSHGDLFLATYDELQSVNDVTNVRVSTVLFAQDASAQNGIRWLHVHETWKE